MKKLLVTSLLSTLILTACNGGNSNDTQNNAPNTEGVIQNSYIDMADVTSVSRFRSSAGHDYSDDYETCRSMKHYFQLSNHKTQIYSPVDGTVEVIEDEYSGYGKQVMIWHETDVKNHFVVVTLFHLSEDGFSLKVGDKVKAGELLGHHIGDQTWSDISVGLYESKEGVANPNKRDEHHWKFHLESWFKLMTPALREEFKTNYGIGEDVYISKEERDQNPLECEGEGDDIRFKGDDSLDVWVDVKHN